MSLSLPRTIQTIMIKPGETFTLKDLLDTADGLGRHMQDTTGSCPLLWIIQFKDFLSIMETPWHDDIEQEAHLYALRAGLAQYPEISAYAQLTEVWLASYKTGERRAYANLENDPRRVDALFVSAQHRDGRHLANVYEVQRDADNKVTSRTRLEGYKGGNFTERMFNLFANPSSHPTRARQR